MMSKLLLLSTATASISLIISQGEIFEKPREWIVGKSVFLGKLVNCGYCLGHWIAVALVLVYRFRVLESWLPIDLIVTALIVAFISAFEYFIMMIVWDKAMEER